MQLRERKTIPRPSFDLAEKTGAWLQPSIGGNIRLAAHKLHEQHPELDDSPIMALLMCAHEQTEIAQKEAYQAYIGSWNLSWTPKDETIQRESITAIHVAANAAWQMLW